MVTAGGERSATICRFAGYLRVLWARGLGIDFFPPCKPLIQQNKLSMQWTPSAHRIAQHAPGGVARRLVEGVDYEGKISPSLGGR